MKLLILILLIQAKPDLAAKSRDPSRLVPNKLEQLVELTGKVTLDNYDRSLILRRTDVTKVEVESADGGSVEAYSRRVVIESTELDLRPDAGSRYLRKARVAFIGADGGWLYVPSWNPLTDRLKRVVADVANPVGGIINSRSCPYILEDGGNLCVDPLGVATIDHQCVKHRCLPDAGFVGECLQNGKRREGSVCLGNAFLASEASGNGCVPAPCIVWESDPD